MINLIDHYYNGEKLYQDMVSKLLEEYDLSYMEFNIIMFLYNNKKYDTAAEIAKYRHLTKSHISTSIKSLEQKGMIIGEHHENDHKKIHLKLTDKTCTIAEVGYEYQVNYLNTITEGFTKEERKALIGFVKRIDENIDKCSREKRKYERR